MGDYAGNWRYGQATDRRQAGTTPTKRPRRDYGMWSYIRGIGLVVCLFSFACERLGLFFFPLAGCIDLYILVVLLY